LETICLKCLQKKPGRRYATAAALAQDLRHWLAGEPIVARPVGRFERVGRWCRRNPAMAAAGGLATVLLVTTTLVSVGWAVHSTRLAEDIQGALSESQHARLRTQEQLVERSFDRALVECERGEIGLGLLWMARSLETAPEGTNA